jgi:hypothetical protein
LNNLF